MDQSQLLVLLFALIFVSALVQSVSGFGYALFSAPILTALLGGPMAVSTILITGTACDLAILGVRRRLPRPAGGEVLRLALWSAPGMVCGAWLLSALPARWLQGFVALTVILAVVLRLSSPTTADAKPIRPSWGSLAGLASGALSTSTSLGGPPTVLYLTHRRLVPLVMRDTLVTLSLARLPLGFAALVVAGVWDMYAYWPVLLVAALGGQAVGTQVFHRYAAARYERIVMLLLVTSGVTALLMTTQ
ncbi:MULTISPECIES: sulfite exporter TauE/SafE family protein [Nocardioides]|uniref:Probable membrane transporter protein n=1 Tax=Nocardioides vastitatis TaxID=2568655 RepID=A0ABW0ZI03_9ACTN|nr:sulfite exporter TauE/SafE family protein [Nocardioides sp.]